MNIAETLNLIIKNPLTHACWLNSLSYLEYRGVRKIIRSHSSDKITLDILLHTSEEVRHSLFFKKQALKVGGNKFKNFDNDNVFCSEHLKNYFYEVDLQTSAMVKNLLNYPTHEACYFLVTWLVETRALSVYEQYEKVLRSNAQKFSLMGVLREEICHLDDLGQKADKFLLENNIDPILIKKIEQNEFSKLWTNIEKSLKQLNTALENTF